MATFNAVFWLMIDAAIALWLVIFCARRAARRIDRWAVSAKQTPARRYLCAHCCYPEAEKPFTLCPTCASCNEYTAQMTTRILQDYEHSIDQHMTKLRRRQK